MSVYGRNFSFRVPPVGRERRGRFFLDTAAEVPIGAPVEHSAGGTLGTDDALGRKAVILAAGDAAPGPLDGILVYEYGPAAFAGDDPLVTSYSDKSTAPAQAPVQVIRGKGIKVVFTNTTTSVFLQTRTYTGRKMVAGVGATPTVAVGDYLVPATTPNDTNGYWAGTSTAANAWLVVTSVDSDRDEVEAELLF